MMGLFTGESVMRFRLQRFSPSKLAALLRDRSLTPYALAQRIGKSTTWVQKLLDGKIRMPREPYLLALAEGLGVHYGELLEDPDADVGGRVSESRRAYAGQPQAEELHTLIDRLAARGQVGTEALDALRVAARALESQVEADYEERLRVQRAERKRVKQTGANDKDGGAA